MSTVLRSPTMSLQLESEPVELLVSTQKKIDDDSNSLSHRVEYFTQNDTKDVHQLHINDTMLMHDQTHYDLESEKQKELWQYLEQLTMQYDEKIHDLESSLDHVSRENEAYESQITALKQHNEYLREASNQWHTRYNDGKISILNANEEIINLKKELTNLQIQYEQDIKQMEDSNTIVLNQTWDDDDLKSTLKQYIEENKQIKKENLRYLNQLKDMNHKYRESATKYTDIHNINVALQNELSSSKLRISDLDRMLHDHFLEIRYLEHQTIDLKQALNDASSSNEGEMFDADGNIHEITYTPDPKSRKHFRNRSISQSSLISDSVCSSPIVRKGDWNNLINADWTCTDLCVDPVQNAIIEDGANDLYQKINDYLFEIEECVQTMKTLQLLHRKIPMDRHRGSNDMLHNMEKDQKTEEDTAVDTDTENEIESETLMKILETDQEEQLLAQIQDIVERCKDCMTEIHKQQMVMVMNEKKKYEDLDKIYTRYRQDTVTKIKRLTKDIYKVKYKKYGGYKHICWEMVGNVSTYTKDAIVHKLTQ